SSRRRHTRFSRDWSSDVCSSDLNLQRLDGPVRGNGKIIQELEGEFRGSGWNVIKLIWGGYWDPLLARDKKGILRKVMEETVDGRSEERSVGNEIRRRDR